MFTTRHNSTRVAKELETPRPNRKTTHECKVQKSASTPRHDTSHTMYNSPYKRVQANGAFWRNAERSVIRFDTSDESAEILGLIL